MDLESWLHFVHVLAAVVWVGGGVILLFIGLRARSSHRAETISEFAGILPYVGLRVLMPAVILVLITGVWMVLAGSEFHFSQFWVLFGLALFAVAFGIGGIYLSRVGMQMTKVAGTAGAAGLVDRWLMGYGVVLAVLLVALWDMVFKPGA